MIVALFVNESHPRFTEVEETIMKVVPEWQIKVNPSTEWVDDNFHVISIVVSIFNNKILRGRILDKVNFNVHAAPPWYRGIGGAFYAISERRKTHGVVVHKMDKAIDHGPIIDSVEFNIQGNEYDCIVKKTHKHSIQLLKSNMTIFRTHGSLLERRTCEWIGELRKKQDLFESVEHVSPELANKITRYFSYLYGSGHD